MTTTVAALNIVLGLVYTQYGTMAIIDMRRNWGTLGFSHFGLAFIAMAFTCGPHHLVHGLYVGFGERGGEVLDLIAVVIGVPAALAWFLLRVEAFRGGRGDRIVSGTPIWILVLPTLAGVYIAALAAAMISAGQAPNSMQWQVAPNLLLIGIYMTIGYYLLRTQVRNHPALRGWSISGLSLGLVFPTCAIMHGIWGYYALTATYQSDVSGLAIDWLAVPAGLYFLWVVHGLYRMTLDDWNTAPMGEATAPASVVGAGVS